jgi:dimethylargininase
MKWQIPREGDPPDLWSDLSRMTVRDFDRRLPWSLVLPPSRRMVESAGGDGDAEFEKLVDEWHSFVQALDVCGVRIVCGQVQSRHADRVFVGNSIRRYGDALVVGAMESPSRQRQADEAARLLRRWVEPAELLSIGNVDPRAKLQHGDAVVIGKVVFLGISNRTNVQGARALAKILKPFGWRVEPVAFDRSKITHLTTAVSEVPNNAVVANPDWADIEPFVRAGLWVIEAPKDEPRAASLFWVRNKGDYVVVPEHYRQTLALFDSMGFHVVACPLERFLAHDGVAGALCAFFSTPR